MMVEWNRRVPVSAHFVASAGSYLVGRVVV